MAERTTVRYHEMRQGERIRLGDVIVELMHKSGQRARLKIEAPGETPVRVEKP